jgi:phosphate transport system ATP-binding protein
MQPASSQPPEEEVPHVTHLSEDENISAEAYTGADATVADPENGREMAPLSEQAQATMVFSSPSPSKAETYDPAPTTYDQPSAAAYDDPAPTIYDEPAVVYDEPRQLATLEARDITAWFGDHMVLDQVSLTMQAGEVTALIGPSGCGKSTFLRILNRMHQMVPSAALAGEVLLDGTDIYHPSQRLTQARRDIGMVFQKPNPFPAMSIYDNVVAGLKLTGVKLGRSARDEIVEECLAKAGLWREVRGRLRQPGGALSGGQQQRLCIARALAVRPRVLLMDEPCSALDPTSTRVIEQTIGELVHEVTIVIVTHNMQQAQRVSDQCAFFLAEQGQPGYIVEHGPTDAMFGSPQDPRTADYVHGRFG